MQAPVPVCLRFVGQCPLLVCVWMPAVGSGLHIHLRLFCCHGPVHPSHFSAQCHHTEPALARSVRNKKPAVTHACMSRSARSGHLHEAILLPHELLPEFPLIAVQADHELRAFLVRRGAVGGRRILNAPHLPADACWSPVNAHLALLHLHQEIHIMAVTVPALYRQLRAHQRQQHSRHNDTQQQQQALMVAHFFSLRGMLCQSHQE